LNSYDDGDGVLSDQELDENWLFAAENVNNTKGLELLTGLKCPKLTSFDFNEYKKLGNIQVIGRGLTDIVIKDLPDLFGVLVEGSEEDIWTLGKVSVTGCPNMNGFSMRYTKVNSVTFSDFLTEHIVLDRNEIDSLTIISVTGAETDYRLAPAVKTYTVFIAKASPVFAFEKNGLTVALGAAVPENKLNVGLYDGEVQYVSSDETVATIDAQGVVTTLAIGEVTITATGAETENCNEAKKADYTLTVTDPSGISGIAADAASTGKAYDLQGRKVNVQTARKGVYVVGGRKMVVK